MKFEIMPNQSVGKVLFGLERNKVKGILPGYKGEFKKSKFSKTSTDDFGYCHVFYDSKDRCNAVEFFEKVELIYKNMNLFDLRLDDLQSVFPDMKEEYGSYISKKYSIGIVFSENKVESILVGCEGYYC